MSGFGRFPDTGARRGMDARFTEFLTLEELAQYNGEQGGTEIFMSVLGLIYDCTPLPGDAKGDRLFGAKGRYKGFAGRDITYALAKMSLKAENIDIFDYELTDRNLNTLAEWVMYYQAKYKIVGFLVDHMHSHPYNPTDLPVMKPKRMLGTMCGDPKQAETMRDLWAAQQNATRKYTRSRL